MKSKILKLVGVFACLGFLTLNIVQLTDLSTTQNLAFFDLTQAHAEDSEFDGPTKKECKKDPCSVSYSIGVYTVTEHGHYWHCKTAYTGTCQARTCDVKCDAL